jgi:2-octaprenyl-6-methoxyphenol hydroxylase
MARTETVARQAGNDRIRVDVLIVGGGMVGLALASALASGGMTSAVVDRTAPDAMLDADFDGRTVAIARGSQRLLKTIGLWDAMAPAAAAILEIRVSDGGAPLFLHYDHRDVGDHPLGYIIENRMVRRALIGLLPDRPAISVLAPARITALARNPDRVTATLEDGRRIEAALVVGADGRNSWTRQQADIRVTEWAYSQKGLVCTVTHERPHRGIAHERFLPAGPFAILPMTDDPDAGHRSSIVWTERGELAPALLALDDAAFTAEVARRFGDFYGELKVVGPRWSYPLGLLHAERYLDLRLALVGDAAHAVHPIAGQGFNLGLRDVAALAEVLVDARRLGLDFGDAATLDRYQRWRRFDNVALAMAMDGLNRLFSNDFGPVRLARDVGLAAVNRLVPLKRVFMRHAMGVVGDLPRLIRGQPL